MQLKITEPGWEGFTGDCGGVPFDKGISTREVSRLEAERIANTIKAELLTGENPSSAQRMIDTQALTLDQMQAEVNAAQALASQTQSATNAYFSREQLEIIADSQGINGLRVVGEPLGIRSNSIAKLIDLLAQHFAPFAPKTDDAPVADAAAPEAPVADAPAEDAQVPVDLAQSDAAAQPQEAAPIEPASVDSPSEPS